MTNITDEKLKEFKIIYKKEYGLDITDEEALDLGGKFIYLIDILFDNIDRDDFL